MTQRSKKLLDQARDAIRLKHYAYSSQKTCVTGPSALFPITQPHGTCAPKNHTSHPDMPASHPKHNTRSSSIVVFATHKGRRAVTY
jgi:hypothetical protein